MSAPRVAGPPVLPLNWNYTVYQTTLVSGIIFMDGYFVQDALGNRYGRKTDMKYYKVAPDGTQTFIAGDGNSTNGVFSAGLGAAARLGGSGVGLKNVVIDSSGNLFSVHTGTHRIIKIEPNGNVTSYAGTGTAGYQNGDISIATFGDPISIAIDASDTLYVAEASRKTIRKITSSGQVSTLTFSTALNTNFCSIAVDSSGIIYALNNNPLHSVYKITPTGPTTADIALLAGSGLGYADGQGSAAKFNVDSASAICVDSFGNVYVGDTGNGSVRKITPSGNVITIVGNGTNAANNLAESNTRLFFPRRPFIDANGVLYVSTNSTFRKITPVS
jgi:streptogramin lyase